MYCIHCGKEIADGSQFCGFCGKSQTAAAQPGTAKSDVATTQEVPSHKKKTKLPLILGIAAGIIILLIAISALSPGVTGDGTSQTRQAEVVTSAQVQDFYVGGKSFALAKSTLNDLQKSLKVDEDNSLDGLMIASRAGSRFMSYDDAGTVSYVSAETDEITFFKSTKAGMSRKDIEGTLGSVSFSSPNPVKDQEIWLFDGNGRALSESQQGNAVYAIMADYQGEKVASLSLMLAEDFFDEESYGGGANDEAGFSERGANMNVDNFGSSDNSGYQANQNAAASGEIADRAAGSSNSVAVAGEYDDIAGTYIDEGRNGIYMFIGYDDASKKNAYIRLSLAIDDFDVQINGREGDSVFANDYNPTISSEPAHMVDLDIDLEKRSRIYASFYISEYDYSDEIAFVPMLDAPYENPFYVD